MAKREMKYLCGLNNVRPCVKRSPCVALIAFISIPFKAAVRKGRQPCCQIPEIDLKSVSRQALLTPQKYSAFPPSKVRK